METNIENQITDIADIKPAKTRKKKDTPREEITVVQYQTQNEIINWAKLIDPKYIVPNRSLFEKRNKPVPDSIEGLEDNEKLVLLAGYKKLADLRGYTSLKYIPIGYSSEEVVLSCEIFWKGNKETGMQPVLYSSIGNASIKNTDGIFSTFLSAIAENRAFAKCVRKFLNIPILGQDELAPENKSKSENGFSTNLPNNLSPTSPHAVLIKRLQEKGKTFEQLKKHLITKQNHLFESNEVEKWDSEIDVPVSDVITILGVLKS